MYSCYFCRFTYAKGGNGTLLLSRSIRPSVRVFRCVSISRTTIEGSSNFHKKSCIYVMYEHTRNMYLSFFMLHHATNTS
uniref:Uncharacterized protein n=1 Tax=Pararge aegeria TaxID=116150 RepID=S4PA85_9NEOP